MTYKAISPPATNGQVLTVSFPTDANHMNLVKNTVRLGTYPTMHAKEFSVTVEWRLPDQVSP
jgi:hypothetical protein